MGVISFTCVLLLAVALPAKFSLGHMTEIMVDEEGPGGGRSNSIETISTEDSVASIPCHVEFQVMKRVVGRCMKLGRNSRGCVAGTYLHPFHPECL